MLEPTAAIDRGCRCCRGACCQGKLLLTQSAAWPFFLFLSVLASYHCLLPVKFVRVSVVREECLPGKGHAMPKTILENANRSVGCRLRPRSARCPSVVLCCSHVVPLRDLAGKAVAGTCWALLQARQKSTRLLCSALLCSSTQLVPCSFFTVHNDIYGLTLALRLIRPRA